MIWIGVAVGVVALLTLVAVLLVRRGSSDGAGIDAVDPLFTTGIALTGAGVALATTIGPIMYVMMTLGLIVMAVGAHRTRQHGHH